MTGIADPASLNSFVGYKVVLKFDYHYVSTCILDHSYPISFAERYELFGRTYRRPGLGPLFLTNSIENAREYAYMNIARDIRDHAVILECLYTPASDEEIEHKTDYKVWKVKKPKWTVWADAVFPYAEIKIDK